MATLTAGTVHTGRATLGPSRVELGDDGRIVGVQPWSGPVDHAIVTPGFVDLQVNGFDDIDVAEADQVEFEALRERLRSQGTTTWLPTITSRALDSYRSIFDRLAPAMANAATPGFHLEGPFLGGAPGAHDLAAIVPVDLDWITHLPDTVRLVTLAPEAPGAVDACDVLVERGVRVSFGHTRANTATVRRLVDAGATLATHCFNAMLALDHREPGPVGVALTDERVTPWFIGDLHHLDPAVLTLALRAAGEARAILASDSVAWRAPRAVAAGIELRDGAPRLPDDTIAGASITLLDAVRNVISLGFDPGAVVTMAAHRPAAAVGLADRGVIAPGCRGDLVALDDGWRVERVVTAD